MNVNSNPNTDMLYTMTKEELINLTKDMIELTYESWERNDLIKNGLEFPRNLIALVSNNKTLGDTITLPNDWELSINYILSNFSQRTIDIILAYTKENKTMLEISNIHSISVERIKQIITHVIYKLREPIKYKILLYGIDTCIKNNINTINSTEYESYMKGYRHGYTDGSKDKKEDDMLNTINNEIFNTIIKPISSLNLSIRTTNTLQRAGVELLGEIAIMDNKHLKEIKNIGLKTISEIENVIKENNLDKIPNNVITSILENYKKEC